MLLSLMAELLDVLLYLSHQPHTGRPWGLILFTARAATTFGGTGDTRLAEFPFVMCDQLAARSFTQISFIQIERNF